MPIDPFAVLNALLRAEAARSDEHRAKTPAPTSTTPGATPRRPAPSRTSETRHDGHDRA